MLKLLRQWICDQCGEIINSTEMETVEWICEAHAKTRDLGWSTTGRRLPLQKALIAIIIRVTPGVSL